jgi:glycosyltransferase involved in cell wall biosynthesis
MQPLVSILIPAYNAGAWIAATIQSAVRQTWPTREIIIVDDGSTDATLAIARRSAGADATVVSQSNQGAAAARNHAYSLCHGDYVQWLDADDLLAPDKIAVQMAAALAGQSKRTLYSAAWGRFYYRPQKARFSPSPLWCSLSPAEWLLRKMEQNCFMQTCCWLVSRELCEAAGPWDRRLLGDDDGEYFCRVLLASDGVRFLPESKVYYRDSGSGRLRLVGRSPRKMEAHFTSMELHLRHLRTLTDRERARAAGLRYLQLSLIYFYPERMDLVAAAQALAAELGGRLEAPRLERKYAWLRPILGWRTTKRMRLAAQGWKRAAARSADRVLARLS